MRPLRLKLVNFMTFADLDLDFSQMRLVGIGGENGAGKSTLIESIRYILFGECRFSGGQTKLVRWGEQHMSARLEFRLNGVVWAVTRALSKKATLELAQWDPAKEKFVAQTHGGIPATEKAIEGLLSLDDRIFINSTLFLQGKASLFSQATPGNRKKILHDILGLEVYPKLVEAARRHGREEHGRMEGFDREQVGLDTARKKLEQAQASLLEQKVVLERVDRDHREASERCEAIQAVAAVQDQIQKELARLNTQAVQHWHAWTETESRYLREQKSEEEAVGKSVRLEAGAELGKKQATIEGLRAQVMREKDLLKKAQDRAGELRNALQDRAAVEELAVQVEGLEQEVAAAEEFASALEDKRSEQQHAKDALGSFHSQLGLVVERLREQGRYLKRDAGLLEEGPAIRCLDLPLALARPEGSRCRFLAGAQAAADQLAAVEEELAAAEAEFRSGVVEREAAVDRLTGECEDLREKVAVLIRLRPRLDRAREARAKMGQLATVERDLEALLVDCTESRAKIDATTREGQQLGAEIKELEAALDQRVAVAVKAVCADFTTRRETAHQTALEHAEGFQKALADQRALVTDDGSGNLLAVKSRLTELTRRRDELTRDIGFLEGTQQTLTGDLKREPGLVVDMRTCRAAIQDWQALVEILDPLKGVPVEIIRTVVPAWEAEANAELSRLSGGAMSIGIELEKDALNFIITFKGMASPYEGYSGGQQFRADYSIRIGLGSLLARRAGARVETLIIDEGFGTQDKQGIDRLLAALESSQDRFGLVLVITHSDDVLQRMPAQLRVTVGPGGDSIVQRVA